VSNNRLPTDLRACEATVHHAEENIAWILAHTAFSGWLRDALRSAKTCDPLQLANDLELLNHVLRAWTAARIEYDLLAARTDPIAATSLASHLPR
jgi:hypothetical protein